jgi:hypothetical protein
MNKHTLSKFLQTFSATQVPPRNFLRQVDATYDREGAPVTQTLQSSDAAARWDRAGIVVSAACAVHCTLLPLVAGVLPFLGLRHFADERVEWLFIAGTGLIGVVGHTRAFVLHHQHAGPGLLFAAGLGLVIVTRLFGGESTLEPIALVAGGSFTAAAHWLNLRLCRCCTVCAGDNEGDVR